MDWITVKTADDDKVTINLSTVMSFCYKKNSDLTVIDFVRSAWPAVYIKGDITLDIKRLLNSHGEYVSTIGG